MYIYVYIRPNSHFEIKKKKKKRPQPQRKPKCRFVGVLTARNYKMVQFLLTAERCLN